MKILNLNVDRQGYFSGTEKSELTNEYQEYACRKAVHLHQIRTD